MFGSSPEPIFHFHSNLLMDEARTGGFRRAIANTVRAGDVVLDLGSGTGILSFFACAAGARRVYAVERGDVAALSRLLSTANRFDDRIVLLNESSYRITLPEPVDVIVTDTFHTLGLQDGLLGAVIDARQRFLRHGGRIVPQSLRLLVVPVELPDVYRRFEVWSAGRYGFDFSAARDFATNNLYSVPIARDALTSACLAEPASIIEIRMSDAMTPNLSGEATFVTSRPGLLHGLGGWFDAALDETTRLSNSPDATSVSWKNAFLPLDRPVALVAGDLLEVRLDTCDGAAWRWRVDLNSRPLAARSTLHGFPLAPDTFNKLSPAYAPRRSPEADAELFVLSLFDGVRTIAEMEDALRRRYPQSFATLEAAAAFVRNLSRRCS